MGEDRTLTLARRAVSVEFIAAGVLIATWASRIPQVRDALDLTPATLGLVILSLSSSLLAMPMAGVLVHRLGSGRTIVITSLLATFGLALAGVGVLIGVGVVVTGLFLFGIGAGPWDVAMNVEGAAVERQLGRSLMPRLHAGFSVGTVTGALIGVAMNAMSVPVTIHFVMIAALTAVVVPIATRYFIVDDPTDEGPKEKSHALRAWLEPRTIAIGVFTFIAALSEGVGNDWIGVAAIDGYGAAAAIASLGYGLFVAAMTAGRWFGHSVLDRFGRVPVLRVSLGLGILGLLIFVFGPSLWTAAIGVVCWGLGSALGFPVAMSAAADDPSRAAARVSVVATLGYLAFLAGPTVIGFTGNAIGVLQALLIVTALLVLGLALAGATRPLTAGSAPTTGD
mgnify:FL=1